MGCDETKDNFPTLLCFFEQQNEIQKNYCIELKNNFQHEQSIKFQISSTPQVGFSVKFRLKGITHNIQDTFDSSKEAMENSLQKMYDLINENKPVSNK